MAGRPDRRPARDPGDLRGQPSAPQLQLLRRLLERAAAAARGLLVGGADRAGRRRPVLAGRRRDPRVGGPADRQLGLRLPRAATRGLALPAAARARPPSSRRRPVRHPPHPDLPGVPRHGCRSTSRSPAPAGRRLARRRRARRRARRGGAGAGRRRPDAPLRAHQAAGAVHGPGAVELVAAPELLRRDQLLVRPRALRAGRVARGLVVDLHRHHGDAGDVPRREHPDDGAAQPRAAAGVPGRHRPGAAARAAAPAGRAS